MDPPQELSRPTQPPAILLQATGAQNLLSPLASPPDTHPHTLLVTPTIAHLILLLIHHAIAQVQAIPQHQVILQVQATRQLLQGEPLHFTPPLMHPLILQQDRLPSKTQRCQVTPPHTLVCLHTRQGRGQDTLGLEVVGETLQKVTRLKVETLQRKGVILLATLPPTLQGAETLQGQEILQATPRHTLQAILPGAKDSPLKDVETLQQEPRQEGTALLATLQHTPQAELILQATLQRTHQREGIHQDILQHTLQGVVRPQATPHPMDQMKEILQA